MSNFESEKLCKNCGHRLESHLQEDGRCKGDANEDDHQWCIANCKRFWEN